MSWLTYRPGERAQLVDLANHNAFEGDVVEACAEAEALLPLACIFVDVDHFKKVNDQFGHDAGDNVLVRVAEVFRRSVGSRGKCYRRGGEEFVALLPNFNELEGAAVGERIRGEVANLEWGEAMPKRVTVSVGIATHQAGFSPKHLGKKADEAMYAAKKNGRNRVETFSGGTLTLVVSQPISVGPLIAIVDGEKFIRDILQDFFRMDGYEAVGLADGDAAITYARAPVLAFASLELHDLKGAAIVRALKARHESTIVVAMSGSAKVGEVAECFRSGAKDFVEKPFKIEEITELAKAYAGPTYRHRIQGRSEATSSPK